MGKRIDLTGQKFGKLTVIEMIYGSGDKKTYCRCKCDCGNEVIREQYGLKRTKMPSCGCARKEIMREACGTDINGKKFNRLTVIETLWDENPVKVRCKCDCGKEHVARKTDVVYGNIKSCGCLRSDIISKVNYIDHSGEISDYGVKIIKPSDQKNKHNQQLWECVCPLCGNTFLELPARVLNGHTTSCGCRIQSNGEKLIEKFFKDNNIEYIPQYKDDRCINIRRLEFDFAVLKDGILFCLIEYDGKQHFEPIDFFGGEKGFNDTVARDKIKDEFCSTYNIPLLRLPYYLSNDEIIEQLTNIIQP